MLSATMQVVIIDTPKIPHREEILFPMIARLVKFAALRSLSSPRFFFTCNAIHYSFVSVIFGIFDNGSRKKCFLRNQERTLTLLLEYRKLDRGSDLASWLFILPRKTWLRSAPVAVRMIRESGNRTKFCIFLRLTSRL